MKTIIAYTKTGCPWCNDALDYLEENGFDYEERNVTDNPEYMTEMIEKSGQSKAPTFDIDGKILPDYSAEELHKYLQKKGMFK